MDNYGFVDTSTDRKYHRPQLVNKKGVSYQIKKIISQKFNIIFHCLQQEEKKMIRYREGKIVSTKGERFSRVTKEESEEMKKSIVNMNFII